MCPVASGRLGATIAWYDAHPLHPSGYDDATVSTAADQVRIVDRAMGLPQNHDVCGHPYSLSIRSHVSKSGKRDHLTTR
jgi:hypothetical protein